MAELPWPVLITGTYLSAFLFWALLRPLLAGPEPRKRQRPRNPEEG